MLNYTVAARVVLIEFDNRTSHIDSLFARSLTVAAQREPRPPDIMIAAVPLRHSAVPLVSFSQLLKGLGLTGYQLKPRAADIPSTSSPTDCTLAVECPIIAVGVENRLNPKDKEDRV